MRKYEGTVKLGHSRPKLKLNKFSINSFIVELKFGLKFGKKYFF